MGAFATAAGAEGVYFRGARLNPLEILERIEEDLGVPVVASNPAMIWHLLAMMGRSYHPPRGGRLLRERPGLA